MNRTLAVTNIVLLAVLAALAPTAEAAKKRPTTGVVAGKLTGLPKAKGRSISVRVVDLQTGRVIATAKPKGKSYRLRVKPGSYLVSTLAFRTAGE